jgi:DNA-binding GntR family transcriptional regulator
MTRGRKSEFQIPGNPIQRQGQGVATATAAEKVIPLDPLYEQIARDLKRQIVGGTYPVGTQLPTEEELAGHYAVSRHTIREALRKLRDDNLVRSRRGAGTVVIPTQSSDSNFIHAISINDVIRFSHRWDVAMQSIAMDRLNPRLADWLELDGDEQWLAARGVARTKGAREPECWAEFYIHRDYASVGRLLERHTGPLAPLIEDLFGLTVTELRQDISASLVSSELAALLHVEEPSAAIEVRRACVTAEGKVVQAVYEVYPASRFRYSWSLHREKGQKQD